MIITAPQLPETTHSSIRERDRLLGLKWGHCHILVHLLGPPSNPYPQPPSWLRLALTLAPPMTEICTRRKVKLNLPPFYPHLASDKDERGPRRKPGLQPSPAPPGPSAPTVFQVTSLARGRVLPACLQRPRRQPRTRRQDPRLPLSSPPCPQAAEWVDSSLPTA